MVAPLADEGNPSPGEMNPNSSEKRLDGSPVMQFNYFHLSVKCRKINKKGGKLATGCGTWQFFVFFFSTFLCLAKQTSIQTAFLLLCLATMLFR